jgi:hypothetical protein
MSYIVRHKRLGKKLADVFADRRVSGFQLARETHHEMDNTSRAVAEEWVHALRQMDILDQVIEYELSGEVKLPQFPE